MSANNIVVFEERADGTFRAFHRDMDAYCEIEYKVKSHEEMPIFCAATMRECVQKYDKWCEDSTHDRMGNDLGWTVEYGYVFELRAGNEADPS